MTARFLVTPELVMLEKKKRAVIDRAYSRRKFKVSHYRPVPRQMSTAEINAGFSLREAHRNSVY